MFFWGGERISSFRSVNVVSSPEFTTSPIFLGGEEREFGRVCAVIGEFGRVLFETLSLCGWWRVVRRK